MANIKSQIKRIRTNEARRQRNKSVRSKLKTNAKKALAAARSGDAEAAFEALRVAQSTTDTAVSKGVLHKRTAARQKSRLASQVDRLLAG
jgi:small subunit ribosomal protein S20